VTRNYPPPFFYFLFTYLFSIKFLYFFIISSLFPYFNLLMSILMQFYVFTETYMCRPQALVARNYTPPFFFNFLKCIYFFFISTLFPYFNLFVSIFIQSYVNINLHVSTLYIISTFIVGNDTCDLDT
jgi:hypothetical protein